ncbi:MAG: DUF465 domain-containing protein [Exiguobacterium profundum]|nr:MAG: DUF465 domain-containing protein [Exiguobacterium profundum]
MSNTPHTLQEEFPAESEKISALKTANAHFAKLLEDYDSVNDQVHRAESRVDTVTEDVEHDLRKKRSHLKDEIARMLRAA